MGKLPTRPLALTPTRAILPSSTLPSTTFSSNTSAAATTAPPPSILSAVSPQQLRHATLIHRPRRPYTFTQLIQLSDGSSYTARTTSPQPLYRSARDTRNTLLWQPSEKSLRNVELDEAGRLAAFRERFGRGFDAAQKGPAEDGQDVDGQEKEEEEQEDSLADLITGYAADLPDLKQKDKKPTKKK